MINSSSRFKPGDLVWVVSLFGRNLTWGVSCGLVITPGDLTCLGEILINGVPKTWGAYWYETEEEARVGLEEKLASFIPLTEILNAQQVTQKSDICLEITYKDKDE